MKPRFFGSPAEFRAWLQVNHAKKTELLVGFHKRATGTPSMTWSESVDQAICFGWIDGVRRSFDEARYTIRFTPRKPTSIWSTINVARVERLTKAGLMHPAGLKAFSLRKAHRTGVYAFEQAEAAKLNADEARQLEANVAATKFFAASAPWYQRTALHWVTGAKRPETRSKRLQQLISDSAAGRNVPPFRR